MSYDITNNMRSKSVIRCEGPGTYTIQLSDLSTNTAFETVNSATIRKLIWSSNGYIQVARGATPNTVASLYSGGRIVLDEMGAVLANGATGNIVVTIVTGGTLWLEVTKSETFIKDTYLK